MKGGQDFYVTKIVTVWLATDTKLRLNGCQAVRNKIGVINHCLVYWRFPKKAPPLLLILSEGWREGNGNVIINSRATGQEGNFY